jgi:hypothetical protein
MTTTPRPAIGYIRVGSASPGLVGELQKRLIEEWATETGHQVVEWVEEFGVPRAGRGLDEAVDRCNGKLIIATAPDRVSRQPDDMTARIAQAQAAGGDLCFVEGWQERTSGVQAAAEWAAVTASAAVPGRIGSSVYSRRAANALDEAAPEQQVAAIHEYLERSGMKVLSVDDAELARDPRELLGEG